MVSKILVPVDGSDASQKALKYAIGLAKQTKSSLNLLTVVETASLVAQFIPSHASPTRVREPIEDYLTRAAESYLGRAEKLCKQKRIKPESVIRSGHPVKEILKEARKSKIDLIVLGSHGKSAFESAVLGSVTLGVINKSTRVPVLIIR